MSGDFEEWAESEEAKVATSNSILLFDSYHSLLMARLEAAFLAGVKTRMKKEDITIKTTPVEIIEAVQNHAVANTR